MNDFISILENEFNNNKNSLIAAKQKAYMRDQFDFFGLKTTTRREIQHPFLIKEHLPSKEEAFKIVRILWTKPERDFQLFGQELVFKYSENFAEKDIEILEYMVSHKSWWDTVDFIAYKLIGLYFKQFPNNKTEYINKWLASNNIWLQRSALLFQLKYKSELDTNLLSYTINHLLGSNEFFINKATGWVLREYSRTNKEWVENFVYNTPNLAPLSKKEALRLFQ